jgi:thiol-disulfide isomerase/thioredoxin
MIDNQPPRPYVKAMTRSWKFFGWPLVWVGLLALLLATPAGAIDDANAGHPGQTLDRQSLPVKGKPTLIDFYSPFCPPCLALAPVIEKLAERRPDLAVKRLNINRREVRGIDWRSPLARQFKIRQVPYFMIFNPRGQLVAEGRDALPQVELWLQEAGLIRRP